jgi:ligand-binding sensor domain-containing protein/signal transduction histidine kinase
MTTKLSLRNLSIYRDRRMKTYRLGANIIVAILLACFAFPARAIDPNRMMSQYIRDRWGSARGFTGGVVTSIAQTPDGFLWIGTEKGLFRFDGLSFRTFQQATPTSLPIGPVQALATDAHGNLWIALQNTKILRYHDGKFDMGREEAEAGITAVAKGNDGAVLLASLAFGPLTYRADKFEVLTKTADAASSTSAPSPETNDQLSSRLAWATGVTPHRLAEPSSAVISIAPTADGRTWLGTRDKGLFYLQGGKISHASDSLDEKKINCLLPIENGGLWIGTDQGLARWDGSQIIRSGIPPALAHLSILSLARDRDSNIWLGTSQGLYRYNSQGVSVTNDLAAQPLPAINAIFEDREGNLWLGTSRGIERLRDSPFVTFSVSKGLPSESNGPVYVDSQQRTWFAPLDGGLHWLKDDGRIETVSNDGLDKDVVYSIAGTANELWVGRQQGGLTRLRFNGSGFASQTFTHSDGLIQDNVYAVYQSRGGAVWAGTLNGGVSKFQDGHFTSYTTANGLASNTISAIAETFDATMWLATPNGLNAFAQGQWRTYAVSDGLPSAQVNCLFEDSARNLWIGTASGLAFFNAGHLQVPRNMPDSLREQIFGISEDREGWLWIATASRVLRVNSYKLLNDTLASADLREFGLEDGLNGVEGVKRQQSVFADSRGRIWFSMNRGLSVVDPARFTNSAAPALAKIESLSADGAPVDLGGPIRIPSARHRITFSYSGLSLSVPERVRYRYRLDGFDRGWSEPVASRDAVYTNLGPGTYQFRVIASNSDGVWNENGPSVSLDIVPEFYQTTWFFLLSATFLAGLVWLAYQRHLRQVTARLDLQYKERLSERTRIARELHDTLLQSFQGLMLHFQRARNLLPTDPAQAGQRLDSALEGAEQAIVEGRNAIHDIRSSVLVNDDLAQAMTALGEELSAGVAAENPVALNVVVEGTARPLDPVLRDEIYRILREALRNAYAHAHARSIEAEIAYGEKILRVRIRDDGVGIDPHVLDHGARAGHWGLPGMRERAKQIGGKFDVWSEQGAGTEVELTVPASVVYRSSPPQAGRELPRQSLKTAKEPDHEHRS